MGSMVRATALRGYPELVRELGGDPAALLSRFDFPVGVELEEDAFIPVRPFGRLLEVSAEELQCPNFGLRLSCLRGIEVAGPVAVIVQNSEFVIDAMRSGMQYSYAHSPAFTLGLERAGSKARFTYEVIEPGLGYYPLQAYEMSVGTLVRVNRFLVGAQTPSTVAFLHAQLGSDSAYRDVLGCPVRFEQAWCGIEGPADVLQRRIDDADPAAKRIAIKYLEASHLPGTASVSERAAELAGRLLSTGHCSVDAIADQLAMHPRTLQRRLASEGVSCQDVIDRERRTKAERYLAVPSLHFNQIAGLLGYTEQSAFNRSCRRWFGKTPREYRAEQM